MVCSFLKGFLAYFVMSFCVRALGFYSIGVDFFLDQWLELDNFLRGVMAPCTIMGISFVVSDRQKQKKVKKEQSSV